MTKGEGLAQGHWQLWHGGPGPWFPALPLGPSLGRRPPRHARGWAELSPPPPLTQRSQRGSAGLDLLADLRLLEISAT